MGQTHLIGIGADLKLDKRLKPIADEFQFNYAFFKNCDELSQKHEADTSVVVAILSVVEVQTAADIAGQVQVLKYACPDCYTILVVDKKIPPESVGFIKKSGVDVIIDESDVFDISFLEFILSQRIRGFMIPVKGQNFKVDSEVPFKVLTVLPLNNKYLPAIHPYERLKPAKIEKLKHSKELYVAREDMDQLQKYIDTHADLSAEGIVSRCRANYMNLCKAHTDFIITLFDKSDKATFSTGKALLDKCTKLASEMLMNLSTLTDPWSIINNSTFGESGSVERSPAIAAMAAMMTMNLDKLNTEDTILAGFLGDVGCLLLPPTTLKKIRHGKMSELSKEELAQYQQHPVYSVNKCLEKKIPLSEDIKNIIMTTHERIDGCGFPKKCEPRHISQESQLLQFCEIVDQHLIIKMGEKTKNAHEIQLKMLKEEIAKKSILDLSLVSEIEKNILANSNSEKAA